ncbi:hypothetical protein BV20DRAFT_963249 [Pilatotrama ljubarskyi]|nr:hypothetical protein BV20DRAFT_963249 [Pilatotrama ljubarskyi]
MNASSPACNDRVSSKEDIANILYSACSRCQNHRKTAPLSYRPQRPVITAHPPHGPRPLTSLARTILPRSQARAFLHAQRGARGKTLVPVDGREHGPDEPSVLPWTLRNRARLTLTVPSGATVSAALAQRVLRARALAERIASGLVHRLREYDIS